jgi:heat shock protein HslJ
LLILVIAIGGLTACSAETAAIDDTAWVLLRFGAQENLQAVLEGTEIAATFNSQGSQIEGSGGCNTYFGDYQAKKTELFISNLAWTEMGCLNPEGVLAQEQRYLSALQAAESYTITDGELRISCSGNRVLIFRAR